MTLQQITADDIANWDSLQDIATTFEKRNLKPRPGLGDENTLVLQLSDDEFIEVVKAGPGESVQDFKPDSRNRHTNLVATQDFEEFTFITRVRSVDGQQHGRITHQKLSFTKNQFQRDSGQKNTILQKLNSIEYGSSAAIYNELYSTRQVVEDFYEDFEDLRTDLVQEVVGVPDDRGDAKQRYVQVILDRLIFLYFIQEKRLLDRKKDYLRRHHDRVIREEGGDVYEDFYEPLFFEALAKDKQVEDLKSLPYLNGGLFSQNPVEEEFPDAKLGDSSERTNELFEEILDFLSEWNWNVDERLDVVDPKNLSPAILGHIFEQTVNQKEMGAYYTPEEITGFMARRSIHPYLLDQLNEAIDTEYDEIDDVFGFSQADGGSGAEAIADGGMVTPQTPTDTVETKHVETLYHDVLKEARIIDPAVGSGAFLLAAQDVLLDIYMQCIEFFQQLDKEGRGWELDSRTRDELETINSRNGSASLYAKRLIILNNLYGVDIDQGAVEICKLRLWLSMVADIEDEPREVEPLPNIDFNIRQGNSLVGFTQALNPKESGDTDLTDWNVYERYQDIIEAVENHQEATDAAEATKWRKIAEERIEEHRPQFDEALAEEFEDAGIDIETSEVVEDYTPLHWPLEFAQVWRDDGFDIVIGNPPWEVLTSDREEYFTNHDPEFRKRSDSEKDAKQEELLEDEEIAKGWEQHQESRQTLSQFVTDSVFFQMQSPDIGGQGKHDLSALFLERIFELGHDDTYISQILPNKIFVGTNARDLRDHLLSETDIRDIITFENNGIFDIHGQQKFGILTFKNSGDTGDLRGKFLQDDTEVLRNIDETAFNIPQDTLKQYSPRVRIFPQVQSEYELGLIEKITQHQSMSQEDEEAWYIDIYKEELNRSRDSDRFVESEEEGDYPVYGGGNFWQFEHNNSLREDLSSPSLWSVDEDKNPDKSAKRRIREKDKKRLKSEIYYSFDGSGSQVQFVDELLEEHGRGPLSHDDVLLDCSRYRLAFREIANTTNERSFIASVLPPGIVCHHKAPVIRPHEIDPQEDDLDEEPLHSVYKRIFTDKELFVAVGLLNSTPFDYLIRTKLDTSMSMHVIEEAQLPRLTDGDDWFEYIASRAARLNCYGEEFAEMRDRLGGIEPVTDDDKRRELQAEIDAAAFHAYGLDREETEFVLNDFYRVTGPRIMTDEYFDLILEKYDQLKQEGPHP
ncbi:BREX-1 system adenine-specific DNA-methyltransferase PglX [Halorussus limi]|uniref:site-specific DNA-methyltransferase (adenine-specific) n=1 Tax=Halorussus limi TaxID=2938695 RepID=A0A8U0HQ06_9EURY|nr:BREX-1 system adenine-specific DNA-methyltransferase PglX [Halorussus limi]UPV72939.1 BREX-1 system adenine-specific DNA-methyltransferase PglX [Halorussus limi]